MSRVKDQLMADYQAIWTEMQETLTRRGIPARLRRFVVETDERHVATTLAETAESDRCPPGTIEITTCGANGCRRVCKEV